MATHFIIITPLAVAFAVSAAWADVQEIDVGNEVKVPTYHYAAAGAGKAAVLWLPSFRGIQPPMHGIADAMAQFGVDVWLPDLHGAYFVDVGRASLDAFPDEDIARLIDAVHELSGRDVVLLAGNRVAGNALGAIRSLQLSTRPMSVRGAILVSPALYESPTAPGEAARWLPIARATNVPVFLIDPEFGTNHWRAEETARALGVGGSVVFLQRLRGVQGGFLMRPEEDLTEADREQRGEMPFLALKAIDLFARLPVPPTAAKLPGAKRVAANDAPRFGLRPMSGAPPTMLELPDIHGAPASLADFRGPATLVSFWASWCGPCIEELPSLARLYRDLAPRGLKVVAVNVGEDAATISPVVQEFSMGDYALLMDRDGVHMKRWNVYGFPTNFVVGGDGALRFGSFGGVDWDDPEVRRLVGALLAER